MKELMNLISKVPDSVLNGWSQTVHKWKKDYRKCQKAIDSDKTKQSKFKKLITRMESYK